MTTGCCRAPTRGGGQDKGRDHERGEERTSQVWGEHRVPPNAERPQHPHAGKDTRRRRDRRTRRTVREDTHRREDQRTRQPTRRHEDPTAREDRATDPQVPTYIPSPCPTPPRIGPHAPCLLGFPRHGGPCRPPIRGRVPASAPRPRRVSRFPFTHARFRAFAPCIRGGETGIRGGLSAVRGRGPVCRSNPPGNSHRPLASPRAFPLACLPSAACCAPASRDDSCRRSSSPPRALPSPRRGRYRKLRPGQRPFSERHRYMTTNSLTLAVLPAASILSAGLLVLAAIAVVLHFAPGFRGRGRHS